MNSTATAPGLDLPTNVPLQAYKRARTGATPRASAAGRSILAESELLLHCAAHPTLDYTAREEVSEEADSLLRHYVGIYDPKTGELQVVPARNVVVRGTLRPPATPEKKDGSSDEEKVPQSVRVHALCTLYVLEQSLSPVNRDSKAAPSSGKPSVRRSLRKLSDP